MPRRVLVVCNPTSGSFRQRFVDRVVATARSAGADVELVPTESVEHLRATARRARSAFDVLGAYGGDGTVNLVAEEALGSDLAVAIVPGGTANVMARELAVPTDAEAAGQMLASGRIRSAPVGLVDGRVFMMMVGIGFDGAAVHGVDTGVKRWIGKGSYALAALGAAFGSHSGPIRLEVDGAADQADWVIVTRIRRYGGDFVIAPDADPWGDDLRVVAFDSAGPAALARHAAAIALGRVDRHEGVRIRAARHVTVIGPADASVQVDGDPAEGPPLELRCSDDHVRWVVPS